MLLAGDLKGGQDVCGTVVDDRLQLTVHTRS
jgi:hypothetical protein